MNSDELLRMTLKNAEAAANGVYSGLLCPKCKNNSVEVFYSEHNLKKGYGIWFECKSCENVEHISCGPKPQGFTPLRISEKFQRMDESVWEAEGN